VRYSWRSSLLEQQRLILLLPPGTEPVGQAGHVHIVGRESRGKDDHGRNVCCTGKAALMCRHAVIIAPWFVHVNQQSVDFCARSCYNMPERAGAAQGQAPAPRSIMTVPEPLTPYTIPVLLVSYFPTRKEHIDRSITGDVGEPLVVVRRHTIDTTAKIIQALETGSRYHGYKDPAAQPSLRYRIVDSLELQEPLPTWPKPGDRAPMTDYNAVMRRIDIRHWVEEQGVHEVWLWGYHGGVIGIWESNMAGPFGDVSNSDRSLADLPLLNRTYTVYHYNYQRGASEAVEDHMHQIEAVLNHVDRHLFWDLFVGKTKEGRCGWSHFPPNAVRDYDWANATHVLTDIEDWKPEGHGQCKRLNCERWQGNSLAWFVYWMQNIPGHNNALTYRDRQLTNWWSFIGDFDAAMAGNLGLVD
jgi:hypothetical protein